MYFPNSILKSEIGEKELLKTLFCFGNLGSLKESFGPSLAEIKYFEINVETCHRGTGDVKYVKRKIAQRKLSNILNLGKVIPSVILGV